MYSIRVYKDLYIYGCVLGYIRGRYPHTKNLDMVQIHERFTPNGQIDEYEPIHTL